MEKEGQLFGFPMTGYYLKHAAKAHQARSGKFSPLKLRGVQSTMYKKMTGKQLEQFVHSARKYIKENQ